MLFYDLKWVMSHDRDTELCSEWDWDESSKTHRMFYSLDDNYYFSQGEHTEPQKTSVYSNIQYEKTFNNR